MQVSVEKISNVERKLTITVPVEKIEEAFTTQINNYAKQSNLKGFRPGKAPLNFIKQRFGAEAYKDALNEIIQKSLDQALKNENLRPISLPQIEAKTMAQNEPLEYTASFEVLPEMGDIKLTLETVEKPLVEITDEDITRVIEQLRKQFTKWKVVDRPAKEHDRVVIDYSAKLKDQEEKKVHDYPLELNSGTMIPGFEAGLIGAHAEETRKLQLAFPKDFRDAQMAGEEVEFTVLVKQVFEADMPEIDENFVKQLGVVSGEIDELRKQIRQTLEQERDRLVREKMKEQVFKALLEQNELEVPPSLVKNEAKNIHDEMYPQHKEAHDHHHSDEEMSGFQDIAKKRVALGLLIAEYAKQAKLKADEGRVVKRIQEIALAYEKPHEVIAWLSSNEQRQGIEAQILEDQVMEKLLDEVTIADKEMSYADLKGIQL